jgi:hypothetical protein
MAPAFVQPTVTQFSRVCDLRFGVQRGNLPGPRAGPVLCASHDRAGQCCFKEEVDIFSSRNDIAGKAYHW